MRFIPTAFHGVTDYIVGLVVIALPLMFSWTGPGRFVLIALGVFVLLYSLFTDYELGAVHALSIRTHLGLDFVFGVAMLVSPWLFDLPGTVAIIGILAIVLAATTKLSVRHATIA